jgi:hypothetical protein
MLVGMMALAGAMTIGTSAAQPLREGHIAVRIGTAFMTGGGNWTAFGADWRLPGQTLDPAFGGTQTFLSLSGDYYERGGSRNIPVILNYNVRNAPFTFFGGAGIGFSDVGGSANADVNFQLGANYDLTQAGQTPIFLQAKWIRAQRGFDNFGVYLGARF